jgi:hypothetical protein
MTTPSLLKVEEDHRSGTVNVESPSYITVRIDYSVHQSNVYWQLVDPAFSLLELGFDANTGRLTSGSIPLFNGVVSQHDSTLALHGAKGTPVFNMEPWKTEPISRMTPRPVIKTPGRIQLNQYSDALVITIAPGTSKTIVMSGENLGYCFAADGQLQSLCLAAVHLA